MINRLTIILVSLITAITFGRAAAQKNYDPLYIQDRSKDLTVRTFGGYKFSGYKLDQKGYGQPLTYKSNDNLNAGLGFNYRYLGLNVAFKAPFINADNAKFGKTKMFDIQSHLYMRKFTVDLYWQLYKGYYLRNDNILDTKLPPGTFLLRPDLRTRTIGFNAQYIFNHKRFSYRSAYLQNEIQKKSSGSVIAGFGIHQYKITADAPVIPSNIADTSFFNNGRFNRSQIFCLAVNAGYAQTVVIHKHFFITGALIGGIGANISSLTDHLDVKAKHSGTQLNGQLRLAAGYNSGAYFLGLQFIDYVNRNTTPVSGSWQEFETGNLKLTAAKRFRVKRNVIDDIYTDIVPDNVQKVLTPILPPAK